VGSGVLGGAGFAFFGAGAGGFLGVLFVSGGAGGAEVVVRCGCEGAGGGFGREGDAAHVGPPLLELGVF